VSGRQAMPADPELRKLLSDARQFDRYQKRRKVAREVVEQMVREFLDEPNQMQESLFPTLCGRLGISDELFKRWQNLRSLHL
jgi:hypothetical protein